MKKLGLALSLIGMVLTTSTQAASLYEVDDSPFAADIARRTGDILTVIVDESTITKDSGKADEQKKYDNFEFLLEKFFFPKFGLTSGFETIAGDGTPPGFKGNIEKKYTARANRSSDQSIQTKFQARVIEIINKDQFLIRGHRDLLINGKTSKLFVSGVIRKTDISTNNTISSDLIADAVIEVDGEVVGKDLDPGIIEKILGLFF